MLGSLMLCYRVLAFGMFLFNGSLVFWSHFCFLIVDLGFRVLTLSKCVVFGVFVCLDHFLLFNYYNAFDC